MAPADAYEIRVHGSDGGLRRLIRRGREPVPLTEELAKTLSERMLNEVTAGGPAGLRETLVPEVRRALGDMPRPEALPPYKGLLVDAEMNLWVREFSTAENGPSDWSVFDPEGKWLGQVTLPAGLNPLEIGPDYVLGKSRGSLDEELILVAPLTKPLGRESEREPNRRLLASPVSGAQPSGME